MSRHTCRSKQALLRARVCAPHRVALFCARIAPENAVEPIHICVPIVFCNVVFAFSDVVRNVARKRPFNKNRRTLRQAFAPEKRVDFDASKSDRYSPRGSAQKSRLALATFSGRGATQASKCGWSNGISPSLPAYFAAAGKNQ